MGVYGTTYKSAFSGLGKPSIKLEFEDNEALLDFQRRMQEGEAAPVTVDPDLANFDQKRLDEAVANHNSVGWGMSDELRDGWTRVHSDAAPNGYDVMIKGTRPALRLGTYGWEFASSTDAQLVPKEKGLKAHKGGELEGAATDEETRKMRLALELASNAENIKSKPYSNDLLREEFGLAEKGGVYPIKTPLGVVSLEKSRFYENGNHILKHVGNNFNVIKRTLEDPYLVFQSFDGKCHPNIVFLKSFRLDGMILISVVSPVDPTVFNVKTVYEPDINHIWNLYKKGGEIDLYRKSAKDKVNRDTLNANLSGDAGLSFKFVGFRLPMVITKNGAKSFVDGEKNSLEGYGDFYTVRDMRKRSRKEPGDVATNKNLQFTKDATKTIKNFNHKFYLAAQAQQDRLGLFPNELEFDGKLYKKINIYDSKDGWYFNIDIFLPHKKNPNNIFKGYTENYAVYFNIDKCINIAPTGSGGTQAYITKDYYTELYSSAILAYYNILVKRRAFYIERKYDTSEIDKQIKYYVLYYSDPAKYQALHITGYAIGSAAYEAKKYAKQGIFDGLGAPGDTYIITDTRTRARKDLEDTAALKKYDIRKFSGEELRRMQTDDSLLYEQIKSDINTPAIKDIIKICREKVGKSSILFHSEPDVWNLRLTVRDKKVFIILNYNDTDSNKIKQSITFNFANLDPKKFWSVNADEASKLADLIKVEPLKWFITSFYPRLNDVIDYSFDFSAKDLKNFDLLYLCDTNDGEWWNYGFIASIDIDEFTNILGDKIRTLYAQGEDKYDDVLLLYDVCLYVISDGERGADFEQVEQPIPEITGASYSHNGFDAVKILNSYGLKSEITASKEVNYRPDFPLSKIYFKIKEQYNNNALLLFELHGVYSAFLSDAVIVSTFCNLPLKKRGNVEICSFPKSDLDKYTQRLAKNNYNVVIVSLPKDLADKYSDLGKTANNILYNNLDILDFRGMQPTYRQLSNYDGFFKPAANKNSLKGFGLADTKKLIADICRNHYKECSAIAKHLKAETKLQSAFNLWHWLHHNIRYEYDREGREEVRTPARVWQDRHRGVDCDCLSVFVWCVLKCMGYNPAFELAAFRNKPAYSHIYINLDGIVIDRVWYVFNSRPPFITKTELFKVGMLDNLGQLF
ncbi:MAG: hypothetical protein J6T33_08065 [Bacteroidales bacterium]|nr:hypothetical protein [Bacteroidales bacterium]MBO7541597.1 hypothetical protein [Bacteroidales bacterium]